MYMGMGDLARYPGVLGASVHYAMAHDMYQGVMPEYGLHEAGALGHAFSSVGCPCAWCCVFVCVRMCGGYRLERDAGRSARC